MNIPCISKRAACFFSLILVIFFSFHSHAATITVNDDDSGVGDVAADDGSCTLREAIIAANTDTASGATPGECAAGDDNNDTIDLSGVTGTITLVSALETITESVVITGPGADALTVDADGASTAARVFTFDSPGGDQVFNLSGLTLTGGDPNNNGGGILLETGDALTIDACVITGNEASGASQGGAIANNGGTLTITGSTISNNSAGLNPTGATLGGGGIASSGSLTIINSTISGNETSTNINSARRGGGVRAANATIKNSTVSGNTAVAGGGVYLASGTNEIVNTTIADNTATQYSGGLQSDAGTLSLTNTIIAQNSSTPSGIAPDCGGGATITSGGGNLIGDSTDCAYTPDATDQVGTGASPVDPLLAALGDYGGTTETHALLPFSPATDAGVAAPVCSGADTEINDLDQRGFTRCVDAKGDGTTIDIGAYEMQAITVNLADPDPNADAADLNQPSDNYDGICDVDAVTPGNQCSLRAAIQETNELAGTAALPGTNAINFSVTGTITYADGSYLVTDNLVVYGPGVDQLTLDANGHDGVFSMNTTPIAGTLGIADLTATGSSGISGSIAAKGSEDSLDLRNVVVTGNSNVNNGGGVGFNGENLKVANSTITQNSAGKSGGGLYIGINCDSATMTDTLIDSNTANTSASAGTYKGGGIYNAAPGTVTVSRSSITNNSAPASSGGGIYATLAAGTMNLVNATVSGNRAEEDAGGISLQTGTLNLSNATVTNNTADDDGDASGDGGGIVNQSGTLTVKNTVLAGNVDGGGEAPDCLGTISSAEYNIVGDDTGCNFVSDTGDQVDIVFDGTFALSDILSTTLGTHGGTTFVNGLVSGSPAIDLGDPAGCTDAGGSPLTTDQRGYPRPVGARCDIGAYEYGACGDGAVDPDEECDNAGTNSDVTADACRTTCVNPACGDGVVDAGEGCDDGNTVDGDGCQSNCALPTCGDGIVDLGEACDAGANNNDGIADACRTTCVAAACGDGVVDTGEACDDGNANEEDACSNGCVSLSTGGGDDAGDASDATEAATGASSGSCSLTAGTAVPSAAAFIVLGLTLVPFALRRRARSLRR